MISSAELSKHWRLNAATIRHYHASGALQGFRVNRSLRFEWSAIWALEKAPVPASRQAGRYQTPLLTKRDLGHALGVSVRSIDRFMQRGLPTRNVGANVRFNRFDAAEWLALHAGVDLHSVARKLADLHDHPRRQRQYIYGPGCANGTDTPLPSQDRSANTSQARTVRPGGCGRTVRATGEPS